MTYISMKSDICFHKEICTPIVYGMKGILTQISPNPPRRMVTLAKLVEVPEKSAIIVNDDKYCNLLSCEGKDKAASEEGISRPKRVRGSS